MRGTATVFAHDARDVSATRGQHCVILRPVANTKGDNP